MKLDRDQTGSSDETGPNWIKADQIGLTRIKQDEIVPSWSKDVGLDTKTYWLTDWLTAIKWLWLNRIKLDQAGQGPNRIEPDETGPIRIKSDQTKPK
jgi:hypothetical protein